MSGSLPSYEVFIDRYRSLAVDERRAFMTDLRAARGWETTAEEAIVMATREGITRRIAVDQPGRDVAVDVVVAADDRLRSLAANRDADVLEPETLRDELFYGIDRETGMELFRTHFGEIDRTIGGDTGSTSETVGHGNRGADDPSFGSRDGEPTARRSGATGGSWRGNSDGRAGTSDENPDETSGVIVFALVGTAGVVLALFFIAAGGYAAVAPFDPLSDEDDGTTDAAFGESGNPTKAPDPSAEIKEDRADNASEASEETRQPPPGVSLDGDHDTEEIAATHAATVADQESLRFQVRSEGPAEVDDVDLPDSLDVQIAAFDRFLIEERNYRGTADRNVTVDVFADGAYQYRRFEVPQGVQYNRYSLPQEPRVIDWTGEYGADLIRTFLNTTESDVVRSRQPTAERADDRNGTGNRTAYRITVESPPSTLANETVDYEAVAIMRADGTVRTLTVTYEHGPTGQEVWIRFRYDLGETEVAPPIWYERARERSSGWRPGV